MGKSKNANRHRSNQVGNYFAKHYMDNSIHVHSSGSITNFTAASGRVSIHITPQHHTSSQQLNVKVEKTDAPAENTTQQVANTPKKTSTISSYKKKRILDKLYHAAPFVVLLTAGSLVASTLIKKRA